MLPKIGFWLANVLLYYMPELASGSKYFMHAFSLHEKILFLKFSGPRKEVAQAGPPFDEALSIHLVCMKRFCS